MMKPYYECHITIEPIKERDWRRDTDHKFDQPITEIKAAVKAVKWKFSCIDGDPELGPGIKCYATMHYSFRKDEQWVKNRLKEISAKLEDLGLKIKRTKIEVVIYDSLQIG